MEKFKEVLIYGFGRMGITHFAILNQLLPSARFTFVDNDRRVRNLAMKNFGHRFISAENLIDYNIDYSLICTPPTSHVSILKSCLERGDNKVFVEKPFGGVGDNFNQFIANTDKIRVGYVLRFNPVVQWIKKNISSEKIIRVEASYNSNTILKKPKGWRNSDFSGVANEMGSHIIDLMVYLFKFDNPIIKEKKIQSVVSDIDDIVDIEVESNNIDYSFQFNWINKAFRKPVFKIKLFCKENLTYEFDQQGISVFKDGRLINRISVIELCKEIPFYLRGIDFTMQMQDFISNGSNMTTLKESMITRNCLSLILKQ